MVCGRNQWWAVNEVFTDMSFAGCGCRQWRANDPASIRMDTSVTPASSTVRVTSDLLEKASTRVRTLTGTMMADKIARRYRVTSGGWLRCQCVWCRSTGWCQIVIMMDVDYQLINAPIDVDTIRCMIMGMPACGMVWSVRWPSDQDVNDVDKLTGMIASTINRNWTWDLTTDTHLTFLHRVVL